MKRISVNLAIDLLAATLFVGVFATGYILAFTMPPGTNTSLFLWGLFRHQWGQIHFGISFGLLAVLVLHVLLHWQWLVVTISQRLGIRNIKKGRHIRSGMITLLTLITSISLFAWVAEVSVQELEGSPSTQNTKSGGIDAITPELSTNPSAGATSQVIFWRDVYPIFESSCLKCHGPKKARGGFRVDLREDFFVKQGKTALIIPGNSEQSPLIAIVRGQKTDIEMIASHKLPEREVALLRSWIDTGAEWPEKSDTR
jgi:hypothetical protein